MKFQIKKYSSALLLTLFFTVVGYAQDNQKIEKLIISPAEMTSTSSIVIHFKEKGNYNLYFLKEDETIVFKKELLQVEKTSFKIDFSSYKIGKYKIIIEDKGKNLLYSQVFIKK